MTREDPADGPERFATGSYAKVMTPGEGVWTNVTEGVSHRKLG